MSAVLNTIGLSKRYGPVVALREASLTIAPGEFVVVVGPSGSGKSTLFRCIALLTEPDTGEVYIDGTPIHQLRGRALARARRNIGVVFQQFNLIRRRSALDNVLTGRLASLPFWRVATKLFPQADVTRAVSALEAVGLGPNIHQRADTLSGGQQQRVAIARSLAQESRILLADEPVASLDPETAVAILGLMHNLAKTKGLGVLCTLHQPRLAERFADRVLNMRDGELSESSRRSAL